MSLTATARASLMVLCLSSLAQGLESDTVTNTDPSWNYGLHGADWDGIGTCGVKTQVQSPWAILKPTTWTSGQFSFLPVWKAATVEPANHGFTNYVYQIQATDGNMGGFYAVEPYASNAQIYWQVNSLRFHYPSEHSIDGVSYDLEVQIIVDDVYKRAEYCKSYKGGFSLMFNIGQTQSSFWDWVSLGPAQIPNFDLNQIFAKTGAMSSIMYGYVGSDSMPDCTDKFCWYVTNMPTGTITQATLDQLKYTQGVPSYDYNNRATNLGAIPTNKKMNTGTLYVTPTAPSSEF